MKKITSHGFYLGAVVVLVLFSIPGAEVFSQTGKSLSPQILTPPELLAPTIAVSPDIYYPQDEILYLEGRAKENSSVQIRFQKSGARPLQFAAKSNSSGEWALAEKVPLDAGDWEVRAQIITSSGETSAWSNPRVLKSVRTGVVIGGVTVKFVALTAVIFLLLVIGALFAAYSTQRAKQVKEKYEDKLRAREREAVIGQIERNFTDLRRAIEDELTHIQRRMEHGRLTKEEEEHREHLLRELKEIENSVARKVKEMP